MKEHKRLLEETKDGAWDIFYNLEEFIKKKKVVGIEKHAKKKCPNCCIDMSLITNKGSVTGNIFDEAWFCSDGCKKTYKYINGKLIEEKKKEKVYCRDCKSYEEWSGFDSCKHYNARFEEETYRGLEFKTMRPSEKNKNNDCPDFKKKRGCDTH